MKDKVALVTGASGFIGSWVVHILRQKGIHVRAGIHHPCDIEKLDFPQDVETIVIDILDQKSLFEVMEGVDVVYHFAAKVNTIAPKEVLYRVNVEGTRNVWKCSATCGVKAALYCSSTAVYGLLANSQQPISENVKMRAFEPYGRSKLLGEKIALEISANSGLSTIIIRPVAVFGPGERTPMGREIKNAAVSKFLLAGGFHKKSFNFVHVEDVAAASVFLMDRVSSSGQIYNITGEKPILFEEAFQAYLRALRHARNLTVYIKVLAWISAIIHKFSFLSHLLSQYGSKSFVFKIWKPGFDVIYSSEKLLNTSFRFKWNSFEEVLLSCINDKPVFSKGETRG